MRDADGAAAAAAVDVAGAGALKNGACGTPQEIRFSVLLSAMLSSQTRDAATAEAMRRLGELCYPQPLSAGRLAGVSEEAIAHAIRSVSFFRIKARNIAAVSEKVRTDLEGDIPVTVEGLLALPGVGPKMAYLVMDIAWDRVVGICVDTHVHRISNRLGWVQTWNHRRTSSQDPEKTRKALQAWLPQKHWSEINALLVGFGQTVCRPVGPRCRECAVRQLCPSAVANGSIAPP
ncbi:unnamed protein product, partial [Phaeothamnion confervicola]